MEKIKNGIIGAIAGDCFGAVYEWHSVKSIDFDLYKSPRFTDDTVMTLAVAKWLTIDTSHTLEKLVECMRELGHKYMFAGYGSSFLRWLISRKPAPYNSYGNGAAMRVSPCAFYARSLDEALELAKISAKVTHNHPEGIKGAQATAACIFLAREGKSKEEIRDYIEQHFEGYNLHRSWEEIAENYEFDMSCQKSVPESVICYLASDSYEQTIRHAIALRGDADTMACISGGIAAATKGMEIPNEMVDYIYNNVLDDELRKIYDAFAAVCVLFG